MRKSVHGTGRRPFDYRKDISGCGLSGLIHVGGVLSAKIAPVSFRPYGNLYAY